jgi:heat shock protein HtpX
LEKLERATTLVPMHVNPSAAHMFIVNPLKGVNFGALFSTHPPVEERVRRLRSMQIKALY